MIFLSRVTYWNILNRNWNQLCTKTTQSMNKTSPEMHASPNLFTKPLTKRSIILKASQMNQTVAKIPTSNNTQQHKYLPSNYSSLMPQIQHSPTLTFSIAPATLCHRRLLLTLISLETHRWFHKEMYGPWAPAFPTEITQQHSSLCNVPSQTTIVYCLHESPTPNPPNQEWPTHLSYVTTNLPSTTCSNRAATLPPDTSPHSSPQPTNLTNVCMYS